MKELKEKEALLTDKHMPRKNEGEEPKEKIERDLKVERKKELIDGDSKTKSDHKPKSIEEKVHFLIDICADKKDLLKLRKILIEFENNDLAIPKGKEMIENDERKLKRR